MKKANYLFLFFLSFLGVKESAKKIHNLHTQYLKQTLMQ